MKINETEIDELDNNNRNFYATYFGNSPHNQIIWNVLQNNIVENYSINVDNLKNNWFPMIRSDIFLSHSHKDVKLAKKISQILSKINLSTFVDSEVWGYSDDLVKQIEERYYPQSAFHVHDQIVTHVNIMLASALTQMINYTECIIFLNTPNSIIPAGYSDVSKTTSPWIYHELFTTSVIRVNPPLREAEGRPSSVVNEANQPQILYSPPIEHFTDLNAIDFQTWLNVVIHYQYRGYHPLDVLYKLKSIKIER